ncbi:MAG: hypothetical protein Q4C34_03970 [Bacteroidales bacterium]|nr:hypothetical protein [Bacteroidales bacterium]
MKRIFLLILSVSSIIAACAQIDAGLHNTRFIYGGYTFADHYRVALSHSLFSEKFGFQQIGLSAEYFGDFGSLGYEAKAYCATAWNGDYRQAGGVVGVNFTPLNVLHLIGRINPHYDSGYKYKTCFSLGASVDLNSSIDVHASYTTIPDYRKSEKRVHAGFGLRSGRLTVIPEVSIPVAGEQKYKNLRVLVSLNYCFGNGHSRVIWP